MATEQLYGGVVYKFPEPPNRGDVCNFHKPKKEQRWEREELPDIFDELEFDDDGEPLYEQSHVDYIKREMDRIENGHWIFVNGKLTYLTGLYYYYLQWWTLEDGRSPDFRDTDRRFALFYDYCRQHPRILGYIRIKKRREGATSFAGCSLVKTATTTYDANCGLVSKTGKPDASKAFLNIQKGYRKLPIFLKPRVLDETSTTNLTFQTKSKKQKKAKKKGEIVPSDNGLNSIIDWQNTTLNAYDSGRLTEFLGDEFGKWIDVPVNQYWPIVKKTLLRGAVKVGFAHLPSTVNSGEKGGREFKAIWDDSDQSKHEIPATGLYRYFSPADEGYEPYIGPYGESIKDKPTAEQRAYVREKYGVDITMGATEHIKAERAKIEDPVALSEEVRMNPLNEREAFMIDEKSCAFNSTAIQAQMEELENNPVPLRRVRFFLGEDGNPDWRDDPKGPWLILKFPTKDEQNARVVTERGYGPLHWAKYKSGIDPQRSSFTKGKKDLSKSSAWIGEALDPRDPENTGMPVAFYLDRPRMKREFLEQMRLAVIFYSCKAHFEHDAGDDYYDYFKDHQMLDYIRWTPTCAMNPLDKNAGKKRVPGTQSKDPFSLTKQLEVAITYVEYYCYKIKFLQLLQDLLDYEHEDRTKYDISVSFMMLLLDMIGDIRFKAPELPKGRAIVKTHKINVPRG